MSTVKLKIQTKSTAVVELLRRGKGASIDELCKATKWQAHSVRAFLTGLRKKGYVVTREQRADNGTAYRITQTSAHQTQQAASWPD